MSQIFKKQEEDEKRKYWQDQLKSYERSGVSQKKFCKENGICLSSFGNWKRRLNEIPKDNCSFVEIASAIPIAKESSVMELVISEDITLRIGEGIDPGKVALIINALRGKS